MHECAQNSEPKQPENVKWMMPDCGEYPVIFHEEEREKAKAGASGPTLEYIERLEEIARAAFTLCKSAPLDPQTEYLTKEASNLYTYLYTVNFMDEL